MPRGRSKSPRAGKKGQGAEPGSFRRTLIYLPILHTQADMGSLGESVKLATLRKLGLAGFRRKAQAIEKMWGEIEKIISGLDLDYAKMRLYQDGLPVCGREAEIVRELARRGSRNHQLLVQLLDQGARLMGTESSELLRQEYDLVKQTLAPGDRRSGVRKTATYRARSRDLLQERNRFIASRINETLLPGETGILFLGMLHSLKDWLDKDIQVIYPFLTPTA